MTTDDFDRLARVWLEDGPTTMSDQALQAALDEIHVTRQRRAWWPARRISTMTNTFRIAAGVAAIALVTVAGISLLPGGGFSGRLGPVATPTASPTASPVPTPIPTPMAFNDTPPDPVGPGTFVTMDPFLARVTFTIPSGWTGSMGGPFLAGVSRPGTSGIVDFSIFEKVSADPCDAGKGLLDPLPGPTVADLASALARMPSVTVTPPTDITLGGYQGKHLTITAPTSFRGCTLTTDGAFRLWELPYGATNDLNMGMVDEVWILDIDGTRLVIDTSRFPSQSAELDAQVQGIIDSIRIAPAPAPNPNPSLTPSPSVSATP